MNDPASDSLAELDIPLILESLTEPVNDNGTLYGIN